MRTLVTGCAGFVGSHLCEALLARGDAVIGVDCFNDNYGREQKLRNLREIGADEAFEFVPIDLSRGDLEDVTAGADAIFHLAAEPGVRASWGRRYGHYVRNNITATQHLLEAIRERPDVRFVYASSSSVYGEAGPLPVAEDALPAPVSPYGQTKLAAEHLVALYRSGHGLDTVSLRLFAVYGPRQRPDMAFNAFCRAALDRRPLHVYGDGHQTRDFTYVGDVVDALLAAGSAALDRGRVINVGGGHAVSLHEVLGLLGTLTDHELTVEHLAGERGDVRHTAADVSLARTELGYEPSVGLADGLAAELEWTASYGRAGLPAA